VLDMHMPGLSGTELQTRLTQQQIALPILFVSGVVDVSTATQAMRLGAIDVIEKPVSPEKLVTVVNRAFEIAIAIKQTDTLKREVQAAMGKLSTKELQVMQSLLDGRSMKEIAEQCKCSVATVARYQTSVLDKMDSLNTTQLAIKIHKAEVKFAL
jgi:two-component system, LuxR family, response regulator FixJ